MQKHLKLAVRAGYCPESETLPPLDGFLKRFEELLFQSQWQPISTAPKDGSMILLWERFNSAPFVGYWSKACQMWCASHENYDAEGGWEGAIVVDKINQDDVLHWMPYPQDPNFNMKEIF